MCVDGEDKVLGYAVCSAENQNGENFVTRKKVIEKIENGKQVGIYKIIECDNTEIFYTYAVQKVFDKYIVYESIYNSNLVWEDTVENIFYYDSFSKFEDNFNANYNIKLEDLDVSKGQKFFNVNLYR